jgi:serine/threonine protein kinase
MVPSGTVAVDSVFRDGGPIRGTVLAGKYRLHQPIGEGGMGAVWRAEDLRLGAPVAVKLIHRRDIDNAETLARFEAEAEIAAQLRSTNVVQVFDAGVDHETGAPFIVMELLEGESLRDRLTREHTIAPIVLAHIVSQVARALTRAHALGIIHRDLKPANIFLLRDGDIDVVKVLDFGIAKRTRGSHAGPTATGDLLGTPNYMSPEQILSSKDVDYRTDLWSLAVIATECLTGKLPFHSDSGPGLSYLICHGQSTLPSQLGRVPKGFDTWFRNATQRAPADRFSSAGVMAEKLRRICGTGGLLLEGGRLEGGQLESGEIQRSERRDTPVSPSVGPSTRPIPQQIEPWRRPQRTSRTALRIGAALLLLGAGAILVLRATLRQQVEPNAPAVAHPAERLEPSPPVELPVVPKPNAEGSGPAVDARGSTGQVESPADGVAPVEPEAPAPVPPPKPRKPAVRPKPTKPPTPVPAAKPTVAQEDEDGF